MTVWTRLSAGSQLLAAAWFLLGASGCASGGASSPSGADASALLAALTGRWTLDEANSTPQIPNQFEGVEDDAPMENITRNESRAMRRYRRMIESRRMSVSDMYTTIEVLRRRPPALVLRATDLELAYTPSTGEMLVLPWDGTEVERREDDGRVRVKAGWEGSLVVIDHRVVSGGRVRETLEVVGDRLIMTRALTAEGGEQSITLAYDRN